MSSVVRWRSRLAPLCSYRWDPRTTGSSTRVPPPGGPQMSWEPWSSRRLPGGDLHTGLDHLEWVAHPVRRPPMVCDSLVVGRARSVSALSIGTTRQRTQPERGSKTGLDCSQWISR